MASPLAGGTAGIIFLMSPGSTRDKNGEFLDILEIIGDPVHELVPGAPEILVFHDNLLVPGPFAALEGQLSIYLFSGEIARERAAWQAFF